MYSPILFHVDTKGLRLRWLWSLLKILMHALEAIHRFVVASRLGIERGRVIAEFWLFTVTWGIICSHEGVT